MARLHRHDREQWLTTTLGQAWKSANANHPFLVDGFTSADGWDNADWD